MLIWGLIGIIIVLVLALVLLFRRYLKVKTYFIFKEIIGIWSRGTNFKKNIYALNTFLIHSLKLDYSSFFIRDYENDRIQLIDSNISDKDIARNLGGIYDYDHPGSDFRDALEGREITWRYAKQIMDYPTAKMRRIRFACLVPLSFHGRVEGYWLIESEESDFKLNEDFLIHLKELFGQNIGIGKQVYLDQLTQIPKREFGLENIQDLYEESADAVIGMLDIDNFKKVNDTYGHDGGDYILRYVANTIRSQIRPDDMVSRHGGEEMLIVLKGCSADDGYKKLDMIRDSINQFLFEPEEGESFSVSVSIGAAFFDEKRSIEDLIKEADENLYKAKKNGKNQVVMEAVYEKVI